MKCPHCGKIVMLVKDTGTQAPPSSTEGTGDLGELLDAINDDGLKEFELKFVADVRARYAQYKDRTRMSDKQMSWLRKLASGDTEESW